MNAKAAPYQWQAQWLQDPRFDGLSPIDTFYRWQDREAAVPRIIAAHRPGLSNVHMLLRKRFTLPAPPRAAQLRLTADDYYKLWVNGHFVGQGPAPGYPWHHYYDVWDIAPWLLAGGNVIAAHVYYQGLLTRVWVSLDQRMGLVAEADIELEDGRRMQITSDDSWRFRRLGKPTTVTLEDHERRRSPAEYYQPDHSGGMIGSLTQWQENIDEREREPDWREPGFDDSHWQSPSAVDVATKDYAFYPAPTPPLEHHTLRPERIESRGEGRYLLDFGRECVGTFGLCQPGREGHVIEIRHAEELTPEGDARYSLRANCNYQEYWTLAAREQCTLEYFDYKAFRYVEVVNPVEPPTPGTAWVDERHYPASDITRFDCSLPELTAIWDMCALAVRLCAQDNFVDCPHREKGQYMGDTVITGHSHMLLSGDTRLMSKALAQFAQTGRFAACLKSIAPGNFMNEIADYSLLFPAALALYHRYSGDAALVEALLPAAEAVLDYFAACAVDGGLLGDVPGLIHLIDHPPQYCADYDVTWVASRKEPVPGTGPHAVLNALYCLALNTVNQLRLAVGRPAGNRADQPQQFRTVFYRPEQHLFADTHRSDHCSLHTNLFALYAGLAPAEAIGPIVELVRQRRLGCGMFPTYFLLHALCANGAGRLAFDLITSHDTNSWNSMLERGATSAWEAWIPEHKRNLSLCHAWAASPIPILIEHILGLRPQSTGWAAVSFAPAIPPSLTWANLSLPLPLGEASVSFERRGERDWFELTLPAGLEVTPGPGCLHAEHDRATGRHVFAWDSAAAREPAQS